MPNRRRFIQGAAAAALGAAGASHGQGAWPTKSVRVINPFPAGGGTDAFLRPIAARLSQTMGQQFIVENMGGAGGTVGAAAAAKAAPDGYTLFCGAVHHTIAESLYTRLPYNIERDFIPITVLAYVPNVLVVHPKYTEINSYADFLAYVRRNPGKLNFGSAGNGTSHHLTVELYKQMTKTFMTHIPYRGAGPMMQDLLAGSVDFAFDGMGTSAPQIKGGKLKGLAVTSAKRVPAFPNIPTMEEVGLKGYQATTWYALWAIKGTPQEVVTRTHQEVVKALQEPNIKELWFNQGAELGGNTPAEFAKFITAEIEKWSKVVKASGAKIDL
ncbi:MAG: tripartite tricarboxylate transporter substrate binding protein [Burkholderiales bacterium]|nr:tripartite tricarboxylate transporter substrate binding protein [Burkholderiales bacterium]